MSVFNPDNAAKRYSSAGFTLIELMVTIAVLAIIVSIAAPNISNQLANQRVKSTTATLVNALKEAKAESIIRRQNITVSYNATAKTVILQDDSNNTLSSYNIQNKSIVTEEITPTTVTAVTFQPSKVIADGAQVVYTVCDSGSSKETARQVNLNSIANVTTTTAGSC